VRKLFYRSVTCSWSRFGTRFDDWLVANCNVCSRKGICRHFIDISKAKDICLACCCKGSRVLLNDSSVGEYGIDATKPDLDYIECEWFWDLKPRCPMLDRF
jgi:hypothetical protein